MSHASSLEGAEDDNCVSSSMYRIVSTGLCSARSPRNESILERIYFGRSGDGFPGDPGGGIMMVVPGSGTGAGTRNSGSMFAGGLMTPSPRSSLSLRDS